jgi:4-hydroxy-3-polyprenylbenzoate decarboxylase
MRFESLSEFLRLLERHRSLVRIPEPVDPRLVAPALAVLAFRRNGPAFVIEQPTGASVPLAMNIFGRQPHIEWALGRHPEQIGQEILAALEDLVTPSLAALWKNRSQLGRALAMRPGRVRTGGPCEWECRAGLDELPIVQCWPQDSGPFITWPLVLTRHPQSGGRNLGTYRLQKNGPFETGMHWQIQKGAGFHYYEAEQRGQALPVSVILGADPVLMIASILPLPENVDEIAFAGYLRGAPVPMMATTPKHGAVPASAEILIQGEVPPRERKDEGPFGDHFGHYSRREPWPVLRIASVRRRSLAVYPATIVGPPPLEDARLGDAVQEMLSPLLKLTHPEVRALWAYMETGFHSLAVVSVHNRYHRESMKAALALLGEGQFSLTKCLVLVDEHTDPRDFDAVARVWSERFNAADVRIIADTAYDSLDFTSHKTHHGSKLVIDLSHPQAAPAGPAPDLSAFAARLGRFATYGGGILVAQCQSQLAQELMPELLRSDALGRIRVVVLVSSDIDPTDRLRMLWGWFTRFEPARDISFSRVEMQGAVPRYHGRMGFDATFKAGYPDPLTLDPTSEKEAQRLWSKYLEA